MKGSIKIRGRDTGSVDFAQYNLPLNEPQGTQQVDH